MWNAQNSGGDDHDAVSSHDDGLESESGVGSDRQEASVGHLDDEDGEAAVEAEDEDEEDDDEEEDIDDEDGKGVASAAKTMDDEDEDDDDEDDGSSAAPTASPLVPRGKPESMAARLAVAQLAAKREEELEEMETEVVVAATVDGDDDEDDSVVAEAVVEEPVGGVLVSATKSPKKSAPKKPKKKPSQSPSFKPPANRGEMLINEAAPPISAVEYENLESLMVHFCRVPLLAEFSRPVSLLHPEVSLTAHILTPVEQACELK